MIPFSSYHVYLVVSNRTTIEHAEHCADGCPVSDSYVAIRFRTTHTTMNALVTLAKQVSSRLHEKLGIGDGH